MDKDLSHLKAAAYNPRTIDKHDQRMLKISMEKYGDLSGVIYNRTTQQLVGGHQRVEAFRSTPNPTITGLTEMPKNSVGTVARGYVQIAGFDELFAYREVEWDDQTERRANIAANRISGRFDSVKLRAATKAIDPDLRWLTGQTNDEIDALLADEVHTDDDDDDHAGGGRGNQFSVAAEPEQVEVISAAIYKAKQIQGEGMLDSGSALERICKQFLDQS